MTQRITHDWLPVETTTRVAVRDRIEHAVAMWSDAWFASRSLTVSATRPVTAVASSNGAKRRYGGRIFIGYSRRAAARLLDWALDIGLDETTLTPADQKVIDAFEERMVEDLAEKIETVLGKPSQTAAPMTRDAGGLEIAIGEAQAGDILSVTIPLDALMPLVHASFVGGRASPSPLADMSDALAKTVLSLDVTLGEARLGLAELRGLAPGDVLVLDTRLDGAGVLSLSGGGAPLAGARLTNVDGQMAVTLQA